MNQVSTADYFALCHTCKVRHPCKTIEEYQSFTVNHSGHACSLLNRDSLGSRGLQRLASWDPRKVLLSVFGAAAAWAVRHTYGDLTDVASYLANANVKEAFGGNASLTITNLNSLARSVTAGWQSAAVDNTSNLFLDDLFVFTFAQVNTAPGNGKVYYLFAGHTIDGGTKYTQPFTGTEGTCTYPDVTANAIPAPLLGTIPYVTTNAELTSRAFSMAATAGGQLPEKYVVGLINDSGMTIAASGNSVKRNGVYATVV